MKRGALLILFLAGCQSAMAPTVAPSSITLVPDAEGLMVLPLGKRIDFGRSPKGVIPALDRELGAHTDLPLTGCPAGIIARHRWGNLELSFTAERFVGWRQDGQTQGQICGAASASPGQTA